MALPAQAPCCPWDPGQPAVVRFTSERVRYGAANPTPKLASIIAGMATGADSIDHLGVIRAGGMNKLFGGVYANATLGIFLRGSPTATPGNCRRCCTGT